ncbi:hypothetical protein WJX73_006816 [Symbiochloris irregularis]|uniref:GDT1 family protein n=1 Tax=Symbiochloris irregularis TaxID=706552 RepID=A0AAW1PU93_9CHLO
MDVQTSDRLQDSTYLARRPDRKAKEPDMTALLCCISLFITAVPLTGEHTVLRRQQQTSQRGSLRQQSRKGYHRAGKKLWLQEYAGSSGLLPAFSLIFCSELGDKTFFIAGLLATSVGRTVSFLGSIVALSIMTVISVSIGYAFKSVPAALEGSLPVGKYLAVATMLYFGLRTLREAWKMPKLQNADSDEMLSARDSIAQAREQGKIGTRTLWQSLVEVGTLIFLAEWGDRSMLATVALGAAKSPAGVAMGAIAGHAVATLIAVIFGAMAAKYLSEKTISYTGGVLFLVFAVATWFGVF